MTAIPFGASYDSRAAAKSPDVFVKNLIVEKALTNQVDQIAYICRPGTAPYFAAPNDSANYRGCFQQYGLLYDTLLVASGGTLYRQDVGGLYEQVGPIAGQDFVLFAPGNKLLIMCGGGSAYSYDGTTLTPIIMPSGEQVAWVTYLAGYFLLGVASSNVIFFMEESEVGNALPAVATVASTGTVLSFDSAALSGLVASGLANGYATLSTLGGEPSLANVVVNVTVGTGLTGDTGTVTITTPLTVNVGQTVYFQQIGPDALDYFSAATSSGYVVRGMSLGDQLLLFCQDVTEFWQPSGDANLPFNRIVGMIYQHGANQKLCCAKIDNTIVFVGEDCGVYRCGSTPLRISTDAVDAQIRAFQQSDVIVCWAFDMDGHSYFVMTIGNDITLVYDASMENWLTWSSDPAVTWAVQYGIQISGSAVIGGNRHSGGLWAVTGQAVSDGPLGIVKEWYGGIPVVSTPIRCDAVSLVVDSGGGSGFAYEIVIDMQWSDDQGQTYSDWSRQTAGVPGATTVQPVWRMLGTMRVPGRVFHWRCTTTGAFRVSYARLNEAFSW